MLAALGLVAVIALLVAVDDWGGHDDGGPSTDSADEF